VFLRVLAILLAHPVFIC